MSANIFVSSTPFDLALHRKKIAAACALKDPARPDVTVLMALPETTLAARLQMVRNAKVYSFTNVAGRVAASASSLSARNLFSFIETLIDTASKSLAVNWDDELVKATALTRDGAVIHPNFQPKST